VAHSYRANHSQIGMTIVTFIATIPSPSPSLFIIINNSSSPRRCYAVECGSVVAFWDNTVHSLHCLMPSDVLVTQWWSPTVTAGSSAERAGWNSSFRRCSHPCVRLETSFSYVARSSSSSAFSASRYVFNDPVWFWNYL